MPAFNSTPQSQQSQVQQGGSASNPFRRNPIPPIVPASHLAESLPARTSDRSASSFLPQAQAQRKTASPSTSSSQSTSHPRTHLASPPRTQGGFQSQVSTRPKPRPSVNTTASAGGRSALLPPPLRPSRGDDDDREDGGSRGESSATGRKRAGRMSLDSGYGGSISGGGANGGGGSSMRASSSASPDKRINTSSPSHRAVGRLLLNPAQEEEEEVQDEDDREATPVAGRDAARHRSREASVASSTSVASSFHFGRRPTQNSQLLQSLPNNSSIDKGKKRAAPIDDEDDSISRRASSRTLSAASSRTLSAASSRTVSASPARSRTLGRSESRELDLLGGMDLGSLAEEGGGGSRARSNDDAMEVDDEGGIEQQQQQPMDKDNHQDDLYDYQPQPSISPPPPTATHRRDKGKGRASNPTPVSAPAPHDSRSLTISPPPPALAPHTSTSQAPPVASTSSFQLGGGWDPRFDVGGYGKSYCIYPLRKTWMCVDKQSIALGDLSLPPWEEMDGEWRKVNRVMPLRERSSTMVYVKLLWQDKENNEVHGKYLINKSFPVKAMIKHFLRQVHGHERDRGSQPAPRLRYDGDPLQLDESLDDLKEEFECGDAIDVVDEQVGGSGIGSS